ncbi:universal stress protein (plasmid) [Haladaptatus sp. SPP-AMP-3]|uniref:universal stress protein n=1 Tax=Haladaptatus sp. SPP-AMP-3 TaxID=3121295 RepID=UPI003C2CDE68
MYKQILVPTDGSAGATSALKHAFRLTEQFDATIHVVYVFDTTNSPLGLDNVLTDVHNPPGESVIETAILEGRKSGCPIEGHVLKGVPHETIVEYAVENGIDLIVIATRGRSGVARGILGSVTENVVRRSNVPVLTVRARESDGNAESRSKSNPKTGSERDDR